MASSTATTLSLLRAALLGTTLLVLVGPTGAAARVGVTSATDGDPLGKPPAEAERVLRIGIDVQANEIITTKANDRAHLVFLDGTSVTVGPNAQITIDKFVYDPATKTGELSLNAATGVFRLVGGKISKTNPIKITTPSSTIGIRGGITILDVKPTQTHSTFVFGHSMTVSGNGQTQNVTRQGSVVTTNVGAPPGPPALLKAGALSNQMGQLEGSNRSSGPGGSAGAGGAGGSSGGGGGGADQGARNFGQHNSGRGPSGPQPGGVGAGPGGPGHNNRITNVVANTNQVQQNQNTQATTSSTSTQVTIVTRGRFLSDPIYTNFSNTDLSVTPNATNNQVLAATGPVTTTTTTTTQGGTASTTTRQSVTITTSDGRQITVPWVPNTMSGGFSIANVQAFGANLKDGRGFVSPNGEFFAYIFTTTGDSKLGFFGGAPTTPSGTANFPTTGLASYDVKSLGAVSRLPFADKEVGDLAGLQADKAVSKLYAAYSTTLTQTVGQTPPDPRATAMQATISISGQGDQQKSYMGVFIGTFFREVTTTSGVVTTDNGVGLAGGYAATYRTGAEDRIGRLVSAESTPDTGAGNAIYGTANKDGAASTIVLTPDKLTSTATVSSGLVTNVASARTSQASFSQPYGNLTGSDYYSAVVATNPTAVSGNDRTTQSLNGFVGGVVDQRTSSGTFSERVIATSTPTDLTLTTNATNNRALASITVGQWDTSTSATFKLGGTTGSNFSVGSFVDDKTYAVRDRPADVLSDTTTIGGSTGSDVTARTVAVSYSTAPAPTLFSNAGVTPCTCAFLTWGWWGGDVSYSNASAYNAGGRDRLNFATYVAGTLSTATDINNQTSSATYRGAMVGNVNDNGKSYIAAGSYQNVWSFGNRSGVVTATFDGRTYGGGVTANTVMTGGVTFGTNGTAIASGNRSLTVNGAFFTGGSGNPVAGQAGSFAINSTSGTSYKAGGTFSAQK